MVDPGLYLHILARPVAYETLVRTLKERLCDGRSDVPRCLAQGKVQGIPQEGGSLLYSHD